MTLERVSFFIQKSNRIQPGLILLRETPCIPALYSTMMFLSGQTYDLSGMQE